MSDKPPKNPKLLDSMSGRIYSNITLKDIVAIIWFAKGNSAKESYEAAEQLLKERNKHVNDQAI